MYLIPYKHTFVLQGTIDTNDNGKKLRVLQKKLELIAVEYELVLQETVEPSKDASGFDNIVVALD